MSKIENTIKLFDIYGSYFNLRINNQAKFKSVLGGVFSILTMGVFLFCIFNFGHDFFYKVNPKVTTKEGFYNSVPILSGNDYENKSVILMLGNSIKGLFLPAIYNITNSTFNPIQACEVNFLIQKGVVQSQEDYDQSIFLYYCFQLNDYPIGASNLDPNSVFSALIIELLECRYFDPNMLLSDYNSTCDEGFFQDPNSTLTDLPFYVLYEKVGFNPDSLQPFITKLTYLSLVLMSGRISVIDVPLVNTLLEDDRGIISASIKNYSVLNAQTYNVNQMPQGDQIFASFILRFSLADEYVIYLRSYEKLQDLMAVIGGFMKLIFTALNILNFIVRSYLIDMHIIDTLFRKEEAESEFYQSLKGNISVDTIKSSIYFYLSSLENKINNFLGDINSAVKESKLKIVNNNGSKKIFSFLEAYNTTDKSQTEKKEDSCCRKTVSYFSAVFHNIFNKKFSNETKKGEKMEVLRNKLVVADRIRDFNYIAEKMNELDVMKGMMLNEHQALCLKFLKKPSYVEVSDISKTFSTMANSNEENIEIVCNYFIRLLNEDPLSGYDEFLFKNLDDRVRERILMKLSNSISLNH